jgi:hypothetical protein
LPRDDRIKQEYSEINKTEAAPALHWQIVHLWWLVGS